MPVDYYHDGYTDFYSSADYPPAGDTARFYRQNVSGAESLVLVSGLPRSGGRGFRSGESWETASGKFFLPRRASAKADAMATIGTAWSDNKTDTQATLTAAMDAALVADEYWIT